MAPKFKYPKITVFWKGHKNLKKSPTCFDVYSVTVKTPGRFFSNFVTWYVGWLKIILLLQVRSHDSALDYVVTDLRKAARPAKVNKNHQTFAVFLPTILVDALRNLSANCVKKRPTTHIAATYWTYYSSTALTLDWDSMCYCCCRAALNAPLHGSLKNAGNSDNESTDGPSLTLLSSYSWSIIL